MAKIVVLGAGLVGNVMAKDLAKQHAVTSVDISKQALATIESHSIQTLQADISDKNTLSNIIKDFDLVVGAVPGFMGYQMLQTVIEGGKNIGLVPTVPIKDSICINKKEFQHIDRNNMFLIQTPQCFYSKSIKQAYQQKFQTSFTDDASVFMKNNGKIDAILGEETNIKITTQEDLKIFSHLIQ